MRLALGVVAIAFIFLGPISVVAVCAFLLSLRWSAWEVILIGALIDIVWLPGTLAHGAPLATFIMIALVWALEPIRRQLLVP